MALDAQTQNIVVEIMTKGAQILDLREELLELVTRFNVNDIYNKLATQADLDEFTGLAHLTQGKVGNAIAVFVAIDAALGDIANDASNATILAKLKG